MHSSSRALTNSTSTLQVESNIWSPFYLSLEENLVNRNGLLNFFHDYMRQAVERKYLSTKEDKRKGYLALADFFTGEDIDDRYVSSIMIRNNNNR